MVEARISTVQTEGKGYIGVRSDLVDVELKTICESLQALVRHLEFWTPGRIAEDQAAAYKSIDLADRSLTHLSDKISWALDLIGHVEDGEVCHD